MEVSLSLIASRHNQNEQLIKYNWSPQPIIFIGALRTVFPEIGTALNGPDRPEENEW